MYIAVALAHKIVCTTLIQEVERMQMEMNGLRSTVSAQGKEVERLQRENRTLLGEVDTHRITVCPLILLGVCFCTELHPFPDENAFL